MQPELSGPSQRTASDQMLKHRVFTLFYFRKRLVACVKNAIHLKEYDPKSVLLLLIL